MQHRKMKDLNLPGFDDMPSRPYGAPDGRRNTQRFNPDAFEGNRISGMSTWISEGFAVYMAGKGEQCAARTGAEYSSNEMAENSE